MYFQSQQISPSICLSRLFLCLKMIAVTLYSSNIKLCPTLAERKYFLVISSAMSVNNEKEHPSFAAMIQFHT